MKIVDFIKKNQIIISILNLSIILVVMVGMAFSFGWFSQNRVTEVTGMMVGIDLPPNVLITSYNPPVDEDGNLPNVLDGLTLSDLDRYGFGYKAGIISTTCIYPVSFSGLYDDPISDTIPGEAQFWYANYVNPDSEAYVPSDLQNATLFSRVPTPLKKLYYIEQSYYVTSGSDTDLTLYLSNISITKGSKDDSDIYKAVRCQLISSQDDYKAEYGEPIFRYDNSSTCLPACDSNNTLTNDIAINSGIQDNDVFRIFLPKYQRENIDGIDVYNIQAVKITFRIWVEGQDSHSIVDYAGTGFHINFDFLLCNDED